MIAVLPGFGCSQTAKTKNRDAAEGVSPQSWELSQRSPRVFVQDITPDRILLKHGLVVDGTANNPMAC